VGATIYACITGGAPPPADERLDKDRMLSARKAGAGKYSKGLLDTVDWCMRLDHLERPQSGFALQKALLGEKEPEYHGEAPMLEQIKGALLRLAGR